MGSTCSRKKVLTESYREINLTSCLCFFRIAELDVADENDINWDLLAEGWSSVRSPQWLRSKWWTIKRQIANHKDVSFPGNVCLFFKFFYSLTVFTLKIRGWKFFASKRNCSRFSLKLLPCLSNHLFFPREELM
jgi:hypothetical protein